MTALDALLAKVEALDKAATKGPWNVLGNGAQPYAADGIVANCEMQIHDDDDDAGLEADEQRGFSNAAFIARARTLLPVLREIVRVQGEALGMIREHCTSRHALIAPEIGAAAYIIPCDRAEEWLSALARAEALAQGVRDAAGNG